MIILVESLASLYMTGLCLASWGWTCGGHMTQRLSHNASYSEAPPSSIDGFDGSAFPFMNLRCLIPHLEALADLLQNPTSLETQYLAVLAAKSQIFPPSLPPSSHSSSYSSSVPPTTAAAGGAAGKRKGLLHMLHDHQSQYLLFIPIFIRWSS